MSSYIDTWNGINFPIILTPIQDEHECVLQVWQYHLDNLEGDINLEDAPKELLLEITGQSIDDCTNFLDKHFKDTFSRQ